MRRGRARHRFFLYLCRWQLSTPILWAVIQVVGPGWTGTVAANLVGGVLFFWVDRCIFHNAARPAPRRDEYRASF
jgi:hypothetical protein